MSTKHPLNMISQLRHCTQEMMASLSHLRTTISDDFARELDAISRNIRHLEQSANLLHVQVETKMIETRFTPPKRISLLLKASLNTVAATGACGRHQQARRHNQQGGHSHATDWKTN